MNSNIDPNQIIDISDPNLDEEELMDKILEYLIYLEGSDVASTIEDEKSKGKHISITKKTKTFEYNGKQEYEYTKVVIDDSLKAQVSKYYFGGEDASNQSKYEILLNNLKICTKSTNDLVGKALIAILRLVIDDARRNRYILDQFDIMNDHNKYLPNRTVNGRKLPADQYYLWELVEYLSDNYNYRFTHDLRNGIYVEDTLSGFNGKIKIKRFIGDVDVWDAHRIRIEFGNTRSTDRYENVK